MTNEPYRIPEKDLPLIPAALTFIRTVSEFPECDERSRDVLRDLKLVFERLPAFPSRELWLEMSVDLAPIAGDPVATLYRSWGISLYAQTLELYSTYTDRANPNDLHGDPHEYFWLIRPNSNIARVSDVKRDNWIREVTTPSTFDPKPGIIRELEVSKDLRPNWTSNPF
jgi:hypothetical protein